MADTLKSAIRKVAAPLRKDSSDSDRPSSNDEHGHHPVREKRQEEHLRKLHEREERHKQEEIQRLERLKKIEEDFVRRLFPSRRLGR